MPHFSPFPQIPAPASMSGASGRNTFASAAARAQRKRQSLPLINSPSPWGQPDDSDAQTLLDSTTEAVASALGVSPGDLPEGFDHPSPIERETIGSIPPPIQSERRPPTGASALVGDRCVSDSSGYLITRQPAGNTTGHPRDYTPDYLTDQLTGAIAAALGLDGSDVLRDESFVDLGGSQSAARELRARCANAGLSIRTKDIMNCKTIAELETCVVPLTPSKRVSLPRRISDRTGPPAIPPKAPSRAIGEGQVARRASRRHHADAESLLVSHSDVSRASVIRPKAGFLEGQLVAFITLTSCEVDGPDDDAEIRLQDAHYTSRLPDIRKVVKSKLPPALTPSIWIVLEKMPLDAAGNSDRRKLQTWIQNANEDLQQQIISKDSESEQPIAHPTTALERQIVNAVGKVLQLDQGIGVKGIGVNMSFAQLGGNLYTARRLANLLRSHGVHVDPDDVMEVYSLSELADQASLCPPKPDDNDYTTSGKEPFDLSPMQRLYFHTPMGGNLERRYRYHDDYRFNQSFLLRLSRNFEGDTMRAAVEAVVARHPMLRCRFRQDQANVGWEGGRAATPCDKQRKSWYQWNMADIASSYHLSHHAARDDTEIEHVIRWAQSCINIEHGPVFAAFHFHTKDGYQLLYLVAHHLVVDLNSWQIIVDDLEAALLVSGRHAVPDQSISFQDWIIHQRLRASETDYPSEADHANESLYKGIHAGGNKYADYWGIDACNTYGDTVVTGFGLGTEATAILASGTSPRDLIIAALLLSFSAAFPEREVPSLWTQEHERAALGANISETVGWFTSLCPLLADGPYSPDILTAMTQVSAARESSLCKGLLYFAKALSEGSTAGSFASTHCPIELVFTYAGAFRDLHSQDGLLRQVPIPGRTLASETSDIGRLVGRIAVFEVSAMMDDGDAKFKFLYHRNTKHAAKISSWIDGFERLLHDSVEKLQSRGLTLADVPDLNVTVDGITQLNEEIVPRLNLSIDNVETVCPVTPFQEAILVNESLVAGSSKAHMVFALNDAGRIDKARLCAAWEHVTSRHRALRSVFVPSVTTDGLYDQIVLRTYSPIMLFLENEAPEDDMRIVDGHPPLPLTEGTPWHRLVVCQTSGATYVKLEVSQAICDMASITTLFRELEQTYSGFALPPVPAVPYPAYMDCLRTRQNSIDFWKETLAHVQLCHFPRLVSDEMATSWRTASIQTPCEGIQGFAGAYKIHPSTVVRVAWALLLRAYTGSDDVCFGYHASGRDLPIIGLKDAVGAFSTVLVSHVSAGSKSITQLLHEVESERLSSLAHQYVLVDQIEHELKKGIRVFNTCVSFYDGPGGQLVDAKQASIHDIMVLAVYHKGNLAIDIGHRILSTDQANSVAHSLGNAIQSILQDPEILARQVDLFTPYDHERILAWNSIPQMDIPVPSNNVYQLIIAQSLRNPDIQAVCAWDGDLNYAELLRLSTVLAKSLLATGLTPHTPLPLVLEKGRWAVVALLAGLISGAIIVPIDAEAHSKVPALVEAVGAKFVLASNNGRYSSSLGCRVIIVNEQTVTAMAMMQTADARAPAVRSHDMACILFTSGSSRPGKAISYSHGALATACAGQGPTLRINPSSRVMQLSSFSSDVSLSEVLTTLVNGGCVCVPSAAERVADLPRACRRMGVNWIALTPSLSRKLSPETLPNLSVVCFRARRLDRDVYASFVGKVQVLLVYGSAAACPLGLAAAKVNATSPVQTFGRPFCGNFWIVSPDDHNRLVPVGGVGELVIGGPTLASAVDIHGQDVKALQHSNRLLKTGHLARYRGEAEIEFVTGDSERPEGGDRVPNGQGQVAGMKPLPLTRTEKLMRGIWAEVLGLESDSIGAETGFLSAGGDMVTARRLVIACRQRGIAVSIDNLLRDASVSRLCRDITAIETPTISQADADEGERSPLDTFVDEAIAPRLSSHGAMIEDVAEASSLQTTFIESAMLETRGNISYFVANFSEQAVDWQRLRNACYMLTKAHPILRTAFVAHSRQVFQTVLRSHKPEFTRYQCQGWRLSNLVTKLVKEDRTLPLDFRRPFTKFFFLDAGKTSTLVMRLSRAQYDESSIPTLFLDLDQFYRRGDRSSYKIDTQPLGYCDFIRAAYSKNQSDNGPYGHSTSNLDNSTYNRSTYRAGIEYWRTLLEDAAMTQIVSQPSIANGGGASSRTIRQQTSVGSLQGLGVPFETVLKGAWSIVLSMLSKANDVVFGQLVEGNNLGLAGGQFSGIVGPKANVIPVRTRIPAVMITPYEYFHCIQSQHIASVSHENVQTADIVQKCTSWPAYTRFSSVVYHQTSAEERFTYCVLGNASCKVDLITSNAQSSDMFIQTVFTDCDTVEVSLTFCDAHLASLAEEALRRLCSMLSNMTSKFVMEPRHLKEAAPTRIHLPLPAPKAEATRLLSAHLVDPDRAHAVHELITTAWEKVLDVNTKDFADIRSMPYYQLWGSLIMPAAELARYYTTKVPKLASAEATALPITTEDIIRHPTMMQQYELIIAKQQPASLGVRHSRSFAVRTHTAWGKNFRKLTIGRKPSRASEGSVESMTMESSNDEDDWPLTPPAPANAPNDKDKDKKLRGHRHTISLRETMR